MPCTSCLGPCGPLTAARPAANWAEPRRAAMTSFRLLRRSAGSLRRRLAELHLWSRKFSTELFLVLSLDPEATSAAWFCFYLVEKPADNSGSSCWTQMSAWSQMSRPLWPIKLLSVLRITANMAQLKIKVKRSKVNFAATSCFIQHHHQNRRGD